MFSAFVLGLCLVTQSGPVSTDRLPRLDVQVRVYEFPPTVNLGSAMQDAMMEANPGPMGGFGTRLGTTPFDRLSQSEPVQSLRDVDGQWLGVTPLAVQKHGGKEIMARSLSTLSSMPAELEIGRSDDPSGNAALSLTVTVVNGRYNINLDLRLPSEIGQETSSETATIWGNDSYVLAMASKYWTRVIFLTPRPAR